MEGAALPEGKNVGKISLKSREKSIKKGWGN
jgi:hypothetical protein